MGRKATGTIYASGGRWYARVILDKPRNLVLPEGFDEGAALQRKEVLADLALALRAQPAVDVELAVRVLERVAGAAVADLPVVRRWAERIARGEKKPQPLSTEIVTMGEIARQWTSGEIAQRFPDRVGKKRSVPADISRLKNHILPVEGPDGVVIRDLPVTAFTLDHGETILSALPRHLDHETRRHVAWIVQRLLGLAIYPLRILAASPLPKGWVPPAGPRKALAWLYPDEDRLLMACVAIPLLWRILWGFLAREGPRISEARGLEVPELDLVHGVLTLDENKTDDPRAWALTPGVPSAIAVWLRIAGITSGRVFPDPPGKKVFPQDLAPLFRSHLRLAGVNRPELFERSAARLMIRVHDLRGTFVTLSSANGENESWIMDRTGHGTSSMVGRYRRAVRMAQQIGLGRLTRLDEAIPEIRAELARLEAARAEAAEGARTAVSGRIVGGIVGASTAAGTPTDESRVSSAPSHGGRLHSETGAKGADPHVSGRDRTRMGPNGQASQSSADDSRPIADDSTNPRRALVLAAARALLDALLGGDLGVAREANETISRLLAGVQGATLGEVVDLRHERAQKAAAAAPSAQLALSFDAPPLPAAAHARPGLARAKTPPPPDVDQVQGDEQLVAGAEPRGPRGGR